MSDSPQRLTPGDILRIDTPAGPRMVQVTHLAPPYPPVIRALQANREPTDFVAMTDLPLADPRVTHLGQAEIPAKAQPFPTFRLAVRDTTGRPVYWWHWDGAGLRLAPDNADPSLPMRAVTPFEDLVAALAAL